MGSKAYFNKDYYYNNKNSNYFNYSITDSVNYWRDVISYVKREKITGNYLDIGCAFGFLVKRMDNYFDETYGIDISEYAIDQARVISPKSTFLIHDLNSKERIELESDSFDLITAFDVLEHTKSITNSLQKIKKLLKKKGKLIVSMPVRGNFLSNLFIKFDKDKSHVSIKTHKEYLQLFEQTGYRVLKMNYFLNLAIFKVVHIPVCVEYYLEKIEGIS